jgi:hypothetical protein
MCVNFTCLLSGRLIVSGFVAGLLFFTSTPSMTNIEVAPVSAMACEAAIVRAFKYCGMGLPNIRLTVSAIDVGSLFGFGLFFAAFNMMTVMSSFVTSLSYTALMFSVGSGKLAEIKLLHFFAISFSSPHHQKVGNCNLCIPLVHGLYPALIHCREFSRVNPSWWFILCQCPGQV